LRVLEAVVIDSAPDGAPPGHISVYCPEIAGQAELPVTVAPLYSGWTAGGWHTTPQAVPPETDNTEEVRVLILVFTEYDLRWVGTSQQWDEISENSATRCGARSHKGHHKIIIDDSLGVQIHASNSSGSKNKIDVSTEDIVIIHHQGNEKLSLESGVSTLSGGSIVLTNSVVPTQPLVLGTSFMTDLLTFLAGCAADSAMSPGVAAAASILMANVSASLSAGTPYLSNVTRTS